MIREIKVLKSVISLLSLLVIVLIRNSLIISITTVKHVTLIGGGVGLRLRVFKELRVYFCTLIAALRPSLRRKCRRKLPFNPTE